MTTRSKWLFGVVEVLLLAAVPVLAWTGFHVVLDTTEGQAVDPELDPDEPGYEAFLEHTPVSLVVGVDGEGGLSWLSVLVLGGPDEQGGAVLLVPPATVADAPRLGEVPLDLAWAASGQETVVTAVADLLGIGFDEVLTLAPDRLAPLLGPVEPLELSLAEDVGDLDAGEVSLDGTEVAALLVARNPGESDLNRMVRHEAVWRAWLAAVAASDDPDVVPGERTSGIGRYVRGLAAGPSAVDVLPVSPEDGPEVGDEVFEPDLDDVRDLVAERTPFPVGSRPGARPRVRVLDAVGQQGLALRVARDATRGGAQIVVVGNADRFGTDASRVVYHDERFAEPAADIAAQLGITDVTRLTDPNPNDLVDLTVVVGTELAEAYGLAGG